MTKRSESHKDRWDLLGLKLAAKDPEFFESVLQTLEYMVDRPAPVKPAPRRSRTAPPIAKTSR